MKVGRRMQRKLLTVPKSETVERAQTLMVVNNIRHLPVLDGKSLVGIISDRDIRGVMVPQRLPGTKKEKKDVFFLPRNVLVEEAMTACPLWVGPGTDIEEAARILYTHKIGCLPVVENGRVIGIVTETDILRVFTEIMGVLGSSSRIDVSLGRDPRAMEKATEIIRQHQGEIISIGMSPNSDDSQKIYHFRLKVCDTKPIVLGLEKAGFKVRDEIG